MTQAILRCSLKSRFASRQFSISLWKDFSIGGALSYLQLSCKHKTSYWQIVFAPRNKWLESSRIIDFTPLFCICSSSLSVHKRCYSKKIPVAWCGTVGCSLLRTTVKRSTTSFSNDAEVFIKLPVQLSVDLCCLSRRSRLTASKYKFWFLMSSIKYFFFKVVMIT